MIVRCQGCQAALKFDGERLKGRLTARCPRCQAVVDLPGVQNGAARRSEAAGEKVIVCSTCAARLKAPAGADIARSRCPRCGAGMTPGGAAASRTDPPRAAAVERDESSGAATRRIDSRTIGISMPMAGRPAAPPPPIALDPAAQKVQAPAGTPASMFTPDSGPAVSLTRPPVASLRDAALGIQAAARGMEPVAPSAAPAPAPLPAVSNRSTSRPEARPFTPYPLSRGGVSGLTAGLALGAALWGSESWLRARGLDWLLGPMFAGLSQGALEPVWRLAILGVAGVLAGVMAAGAGSPGRQDAPLSIPRCAGSALLPGLLLGMLAILLPAGFADVSGVWPAVNWMRDLLLVGLLTPAVNRLLPGER